MPSEDVELKGVQIALLVPRNGTDGRFDAVLTQVGGNFFGVVFARADDAVSNGFGSGVCRHLEGTTRVAALVAEGFDDVCVGFVLGEVGRQCNQHAFYGIAANSVDVGVTDAFGAHEGHVKALFGALAKQQTHFGMVATVVDEVSPGAFQFGDDSGVVAVAGIDAFKHGHVDAGLFELATYRGGNALPVRLFVVQDGDQFGLDGFDDELCSGRTLLVVATNGTENEFKVFAIGDGRRGGRRR